MTNAFAGFIASMGIALIITALTMEGRKSKQVIDSAASGTAEVIDAVLGR